jgi:hypothetical protein
MRQSHGIVARAPGDCIGHLSARFGNDMPGECWEA